MNLNFFWLRGQTREASSRFFEKIPDVIFFLTAKEKKSILNKVKDIKSGNSWESDWIYTEIFIKVKSKKYRKPND